VFWCLFTNEDTLWWISLAFNPGHFCKFLKFLCQCLVIKNVIPKLRDFINKNNFNFLVEIQQKALSNRILIFNIKCAQFILHIQCTLQSSFSTRKKSTRHSYNFCGKNLMELQCSLGQIGQCLALRHFTSSNQLQYLITVLSYLALSVTPYCKLKALWGGNW